MLWWDHGARSYHVLWVQRAGRHRAIPVPSPGSRGWAFFLTVSAIGPTLTGEHMKQIFVVYVFMEGAHSVEVYHQSDDGSLKPVIASDGQPLVRIASSKRKTMQNLNKELNLLYGKGKYEVSEKDHADAQ